MATQSYSNPPIVEAVFEFRFAEPLSERDLDRLRERFSSKYPKIDQQQMVEVEINQNGSASSKAKLIGFKLTSSSALEVVLMQVQQFGSIRMAPYDGWDSFINTAKKNYDDFAKIAGRRTLTRVGTRFINRLDIPTAEMQGVDILEFLRFGVAMPDEMSKTIGPYSVAANFTVNNVKVLAQSGVTAPALLGHFSLVFDIDAFIDQDIPPHKDAIWKVGDALREAKNRVFETGITDRLRDRFK